MAVWSKEQGEVAIKIALVGQSGAGKARILNELASIHAHAPVKTSVIASADVLRTEYILPDPLVTGEFVRVRVFGISGAPTHQAAEQLVLSQADGVVFVVDCDARYISNSRDVLLKMIQNAGHVGLDLNQVALAMQYHRAELYPGLRAEELDQWLGIDHGQVARHITRSDDTRGICTALNSVVEKAVSSLTKLTSLKS